MPAPSKLSIATSSVQRLIKEEASYHKEIQQQQERIRKSEQGDSSDENAEYILKQERQALEETKKVMPQLRERLRAAVEQLELQLQDVEGSVGGEQTEEQTKATQVLDEAKSAIGEVREMS